MNRVPELMRPEKREKGRVGNFSEFHASGTATAADEKKFKASIKKPVKRALKVASHDLMTAIGLMVLSMYELSHPGPPNVVLLVTRLSWLLLGTSGIRLWELLLKKSKIITGSARWDEMRHRLLAGTQDRDGDVQYVWGKAVELGVLSEKDVKRSGMDPPAYRSAVYHAMVRLAMSIGNPVLWRCQEAVLREWTRTKEPYAWVKRARTELLPQPMTQVPELLLVEAGLKLKNLPTLVNVPPPVLDAVEDADLVALNNDMPEDGGAPPQG